MQPNADISSNCERSKSSKIKTTFFFPIMFTIGIRSTTLIDKIFFALSGIGNLSAAFLIFPNNFEANFTFVSSVSIPKDSIKVFMYDSRTFLVKLSIESTPKREIRIIIKSLPKRFLSS